MGFSISGITAGGTALLLTHVPPNASVTLTTQDVNSDVAWGPASTVTYATGSIIPPGGAITFTNPATGKPFDVWVIALTGNHEVSAQVVTPY